jgi:hypothetical protein
MTKLFVTLMLLIPLNLFSQSLAYKNKIAIAIYGQESSYGRDTVNKNETQSKGDMQITSGMVDYINSFSSIKFTYADRYNYKKSMLMFFIYTNKTTPSWNYEQVARKWNGGPRGMQKESTKVYWELVQKRL